MSMGGGIRILDPQRLRLHSETRCFSTSILIASKTLCYSPLTTIASFEPIPERSPTENLHVTLQYHGEPTHLTRVSEREAGKCSRLAWQ
jgi:hypothetical protein